MTEELISELVAKAQKGDLQAFETLVGEHYTRIYNIALGMMGNPHDAEDVAQDVLIRLHRSIGSFRFRSRFSTWVYRITANVCMDELRRRKRAGAIVDDIPVDVTASEESTPEAHTLSREAVAEIRRAISRLKAEYREVLVLRDINGFSYEEIASITRCSVGTVKSRINRARNALKDTLVASGYFN